MKPSAVPLYSRTATITDGLADKTELIRKAITTGDWSEATHQVGSLFGEHSASQANFGAVDASGADGAGNGGGDQNSGPAFPEPKAYFGVAQAEAMRRVGDASLSLANAHYHFLNKSQVWGYTFYSNKNRGTLITVSVQFLGKVLEVHEQRAPEDYFAGNIDLNSLIPLKQAYAEVKAKYNIDPVEVSIYRTNPFWGPEGQSQHPGVWYRFLLPGEQEVRILAATLQPPIKTAEAKSVGNTTLNSSPANPSSIPTWLDRGSLRIDVAQTQVPGRGEAGLILVLVDRNNSKVTFVVPDAISAHNGAKTTIAFTQSNGEIAGPFDLYALKQLNPGELAGLAQLPQ